MWEAIGNVLTSSNAIPVLIVCGAAIVVLSILGKYGLLNIHTKNFTLGVSDKERQIIRNQLEFAESFCMSFKIPKVEGYNEYIGKYILERMYDEVVKWISFNHITDDDVYVHIKQEKVFNLIQTLAQREEYKSDEFKELVDKGVETLIKELIKIRKYYS